jgi:DNA transformation protein and related proteins
MSTGALPDFVAHCVELLDDIGPVAARRMFGGWGLYVQGCMVALIAEDTLYLKVDAQSRPLFEADGLQPFVYEAPGKRVEMSYFQPPETAMEERGEMRPWALAARDAAFRAAAARPKKTRAPAPRTAAGLLNLGPKTGAWLAQIGVHTPTDLKRVGAVRAYAQIKARQRTASLNLLYALHGALAGERWDKLAAATKRDLAQAAQNETKLLEKRVNSGKKRVAAKD